MLSKSTLILRFLLQQYRRRHVKKIWKPKYYQAIPHYVKPHFIDIHDTYEKRSKQEIKKELQGKQFSLDYSLDLYPEDDKDGVHKQRKAKMQFDIQQFNFTHLQLERFKVLMGCRYKQGKKDVKLTCDTFPEYKQNLDKLNEMFLEIIVESKRAP